MSTVLSVCVVSLCVVLITVVGDAVVVVVEVDVVGVIVVVVSVTISGHAIVNTTPCIAKSSSLGHSHVSPSSGSVSNI